jgi:hypothetical protein
VVSRIAQTQNTVFRSPRRSTAAAPPAGQKAERQGKKQQQGKRSIHILLRPVCLQPGASENHRNAQCQPQPGLQPFLRVQKQHQRHAAKAEHHIQRHFPVRRRPVQERGFLQQQRRRNLPVKKGAEKQQRQKHPQQDAKNAVGFLFGA